MLNPKELEEYFERSNLSGVAVEVIMRIRTSQPERRVASGEASVACRFASTKMGLTIQAESHHNELPGVIGWEYDADTYEFWDQPQKLKISYIGKEGKRVTHTTTPDFFLLQEGFTGWVECKTEAKLQESLDSGSQLFVKDESGNWRCPAGEAAAAEFGLQFIVRSSVENNTTFVRNLVFLADYIDSRCPSVPVENAKEILDYFVVNAWHELKSLVNAGSNADYIYKLVADQKLYFDMHNQLLARTHLSVIFRDRAAAEAYKLHSKSQDESKKFTTELKIAVGESFLWDGIAWTIVNLGSKCIHIKNAEGVVQDLKYSMFEQLAEDEIITGVQKIATDEDNRIAEVLRHASPDSHKRATERFRQIFPDDPSQTTAPKRTLRRWRKMYRDAEILYGNGYIGLLSNTINRGNRHSKIDQSVWQIVDEVLKEFYLKPNGRSATVCWGEVELRCTEAGLTAPSEKTFLTHIKKLIGNDVKKVREGEKAAYSSSPFIWYLDQTTPRHGDRAFEIGHIDHTELDLQLVDSKYGKNTGKVWLTVLLDAYSRMVLAWVLSYESPSYRSCMAVIQHCVKRHGRVPKFFVLDQGSEFRSIYFESLLGSLESHKKERPGSKPRFGSVIERFFGMNNQTFIHNLQGHNKPLQNPRALSSSHDPRNLAVWTLPELKQAFQNYIENAYSKMIHAALGVSPEEAMAVSLSQSGHRPHKLIPYTNQFSIMCWPSTQKGTAKVDSSRGIKIGHIYYWSSEFRNPRIANRQVPVRYDPYNKAYATAWLVDHWAPCVSEYQAVFEGLTEKQINDATQEIKARLKQEHKRRSINAQILAAYFRDITKTEEGLTSQLRHLDSLEAPKLQTLASDQPKQLPDLNPVETENIWANINTRVMGEFEL